MKRNDARPSDKVFSAKRLIPAAILVGALVLVVLFGIDDYISLDALRDNREWLLAQVADHQLLSVLIFMVAYAAAVALSVPGATVLTIAGGFLFGQIPATCYAVMAATVGATIVFVVAKGALHDLLRAKAGPWLKRMEAGFAENGLSYMLVLRLVPIFPFFVVNLVPAFLGVPLGTYVVGTFFGIIPGTFVYASVGAGLGSIFEAGGDISPAGVLTPEIITALVGLALLALLPIVYKKLAGKNLMGGKNGPRRQ
ncbi:TVP38/TMEM64 family protein [Rhodospirillaceae bacterium SYSU D60014]|uniref:TVP38/TMEM64 family protein n=1 Tax=Virgifigura deserti TaxID=2268457 RepID=UPI000E66E7C4